MMTSLVQVVWKNGCLWTSGPGVPDRMWARPADLAAARLALLPPPDALPLAEGADLLTAAFAVVPFVQGPLPPPVFGPGVTVAARAAFSLFTDEARGALCVLRGEPDDFLVCARRTGPVWMVGAFTVAPTTLTVRFEDLWERLPEAAQAFDYRMDVVRDPHAKDTVADQAAGVVRETFTGVAPDARICLDLARGGGFTLTLAPTTEGVS